MHTSGLYARCASRRTKPYCDPDVHLHDALLSPQGILIDVCKLFGDDTVFLQQASHLTGGSYFRLDDRRGLLQTLMVRRSIHPPSLAAPFAAPTSFSLYPDVNLFALPCQTSYLPSRSIRNLLHLPMQDEVDFRAACFCHRDIVDVGYVCSVCLSSKSCCLSLGDRGRSFTYLSLLVYSPFRVPPPAVFCQPREVCSTCK